MLKEYLQTEQDNWRRLGTFGDVFKQFLLANGKAFKAAPFAGKKMEAKQCFSNAFDYADSRLGTRYVEGFAINTEMMIMAFHHAWTTDDGETVIDPTLAEPEKYAFFGMAFDIAFVRKEIIRKGFYGLFDNGFGYDVDLMIKIDPKFRDFIEEAQGMSRRMATAGGK